MKTQKLFISILVFSGIVAVSVSQTGKAVKIGDQEWMSKNLDVSTFRNGEAIPHAKTADEWVEACKKGEPAWCYYENDPANGKIYGRLYNWYAVSDGRNIAPKGWHVPTAADLQTLIDYYGGNDAAGGGMKEKGTEHWNSPNTGATNEDGFTALPGGYRDEAGGFFTMGNYATFWTATDCGRLCACGRHLSRGDTKVYINNVTKNYGFSVRCVTD